MTSRFCMRTRNYAVIFLLLLWMTPQGFGLVCDLRKWEIKKQQQQRMQTGLVSLHLKADEVRWMDKKEIFVNGKMFDLADIQFKDGWYTFTGVFDDAETELVLLQQQSTQQEKDQNLLSVLFQYLQQLYHESPAPLPQPVSTELSPPLLRNTVLLTTTLEVSTPPPRANS